MILFGQKGGKTLTTAEKKKVEELDKIVDVAESRDLTDADNHKVLYLTGDSKTVNLPAGLPTGFVCNITPKEGLTGTFTIAAGVTLEDGTSAGLTVAIASKQMIHVFINSSSEACVRGN